MSEHEPDLTPDQETRLRRLLADARLDEPMPDDVAARLDRVLEQLREQEPAPAEDDDEPTDPGSPLAAVIDLGGRRRRLAGALLIAAAAVVVAGVGVRHIARDDSISADDTASDPAAASAPHAGASYADGVVPDLSSKSTSRAAEGSGAAGAGDSGVSGDMGIGTGADPSLGGLTQDTQGSTLAPTSAPVPFAEVALRHATFARQVRHLQSRAKIRTEALNFATDSAYGLRLSSCAGRFGAGRRVPVTYDGIDAVLVFRKPSADAQVVDLFRCGSSEILRTTTLPAR